MQHETQLLQWQKNTPEDTDLAAELATVLANGDTAGAEDRFYRGLSFGTGGLRGIIGAGTNRVNVYTIAQATQGLAQYLLQSTLPRKVAIAYDSRIKSGIFAMQAARVLAANGIAVVLFPALAPTPALSFAVRHYGCGAGVCVTASHNPAAYNGYKVYAPDGCQITEQAAKLISTEIAKANIFTGVKRITQKEAENAGLITYVNEATINAYINAVLALRMENTPNNSLSLVYTPLNGAGMAYVQRALNATGIYSLTIVPEQKDPDGTFPTCPYPNPEIPEAMALGLKLCKKTGADLLLATDPDCDRVGVAAKNGEEYRLLTGNETGILLLDYICQKRVENGTMPPNPVAVKTIVTSEMAACIAQEYGVELINVLTGFKYIGAQIGRLEAAGQAERFVFGFEESCGYLSGSHVRDKDGVNAAVLICDMAQHYKRKGLTLPQAMDALYDKHGFYLNYLDSFTFEGMQGLQNMKELMATLRKSPPKAIGSSKTSFIKDYNLPNSTGLPASDVVQIGLDGNVLITIRPSGTEPKIKIYYSIKAATRASADNILPGLRADINKTFFNK